MIVFLVEIWMLLKPYITEIILLVSAIIAYRGLVISSKSLREHNRPYITFNVEPGQDLMNVVIAIRNTGNRGASEVLIKITPPLRSSLYHLSDENDPISELSIPFMSPGQEIVSHYDQRSRMASSDLVKRYNIEISYKHSKQAKHHDTFIIDLSYISKVHFKLQPQKPTFI